MFKEKMPPDTLRAAGIEPESIVDGPGFRFAIFVQGCPHRCVKCHNVAALNFWGGYDVTIDKILEDFKEYPISSGMTFSGGEPFSQPIPLATLAEKVHKLGYDVICYTGYTYEELVSENEPDRMRLLQNVDVLIDGRFEIDKKSFDLNFVGSSNQRIIDVKKTLESSVVTLKDFTY